MSYACCPCEYDGRSERIATRKAQLAGFEVRVVWRDREVYAYAPSLIRSDRINFRIVDGIVRSAEVG